MKIKIFLVMSLLLSGVNIHYSSAQMNVWNPDNQNGTFTNPIMWGDWPDPDLIRVDDKFYLVSTSMHYVPGCPIAVSEDLVNWEMAGYALDRYDEDPKYDMQGGNLYLNGAWATTIRHHNGKFYVGFCTPYGWGRETGHFSICIADDVKGPWERTIFPEYLYDPGLFFDEDGKVYVVHGQGTLYLTELNSDVKSVKGKPVKIWQGGFKNAHELGGGFGMEGSHMYRINGKYYITCPAGGTGGWQICLRSDNIYGPYESKIVMAQGKTTINGPHQGGWVDTNTVESWFVHFQDQGAYGLVIHLNPMKWVNEWPVIGVDKDKDGCGEPVTTYKKPNVGKMYPVTTPPESDEFDTRHLGLQWQWHANKQDTYGFTTDLGYIRLYAGSLSKEFVNFWEVPNLLLQKFPAEEFTATTKLTFTAKQDGEQAGMIVMGWDYSYLSVRKAGDKFILQQVVCKDAEQQHPEQVKELASFPVEYLKMPGVADNEWKTVYLRVKVAKGAVCTFAYSLDGKKYTAAGEPFTARQGKWIGAKVGLFCVTPNDGNRGWADVDWFRVTK